MKKDKVISSSIGSKDWFLLPTSDTITINEWQRISLKTKIPYLNAFLFTDNHIVLEQVKMLFATNSSFKDEESISVIYWTGQGLKINTPTGYHLPNKLTFDSPAQVGVSVRNRVVVMRGPEKLGSVVGLLLGSYSFFRCLSDEYYGFHASALTDNASSILILGAGGGGKTLLTLVLALKYGLKYVSDDWVEINRDCSKLKGVQTDILLREGDVEKVGQYVAKLQERVKNQKIITSAGKVVLPISWVLDSVAPTGNEISHLVLLHKDNQLSLPLKEDDFVQYVLRSNPHIPFIDGNYVFRKNPARYKTINAIVRKYQNFLRYIFRRFYGRISVIDISKTDVDEAALTIAKQFTIV